MLGKGAFGVVYAAQEKQGSETFACKSIAKAKLVSEVSRKADNQRHIPSIQVLRVGGHALSAHHCAKGVPDPRRSEDVFGRNAWLL